MRCSRPHRDGCVLECSRLFHHPPSRLEVVVVLEWMMPARHSTREREKGESQADTQRHHSCVHRVGKSQARHRSHGRCDLPRAYVRGPCGVIFTVFVVSRLGLGRREGERVLRCALFAHLCDHGRADRCEGGFSCVRLLGWACVVTPSPLPLLAFHICTSNDPPPSHTHTHTEPLILFTGRHRSNSIFLCIFIYIYIVCEAQFETLREQCAAVDSADSPLLHST